MLHLGIYENATRAAEARVRQRDGSHMNYLAALCKGERRSQQGENQGEEPL
jgi:hypothetical protein